MLLRIHYNFSPIFVLKKAITRLKGMLKVSVRYLFLSCLYFMFLSQYSFASHVYDRTALCLLMVSGVNKITSEELIELVRNEKWYVIIDVRDESEWRTGHIDSSINIPVDSITSDILLNIVNKDEPVIVYCDGIACERSLQAVEKIRTMGWERIYWLYGGLSEWTNLRYPQVKGMKSLTIIKGDRH